MSVDVAGKSLVELLDMLEPAPAPDPVSMMPQTWGWGVLAVVLIGLIAFGVHAFQRHRRLNAYRRQALSELAAADNSAAITAEILRRAALVAFPRNQVAGLYGENWLNFLKQTSGNMSFPDKTFKSLIEAPYRDAPADPDLTTLAKQWIKTHKSDRRAQ